MTYDRAYNLLATRVCGPSDLPTISTNDAHLKTIILLQDIENILLNV